MNIKEYYVDEIIKFAFLLKQDFEKDERERAEYRAKFKVVVPFTPKQVSAVLPKENEEVKKYKGKTIKKRPDGRYWARFYDKEGKQRSVYGRTQNECLQKLKEALKAQANETNISSNITLGDWLTKWLELYKIGKVKQSTLEQMQRYLKDVQPIVGKKLNSLTSIELQSFLNGVEAPRKREKIFEYLKDALTKAVKNKVLKDNPIEAVERPKVKKKKSRALTQDEERLFVEECARSNQGDLLLLCLYQGLRLGEAVALTYDDVDFVNNTISITKSVDSCGELTTPKTETSVRVIPLFKRALVLFERDGSGKVFKYNRKVYQNAMLKICKSIGLKNISIHSLRHTFATRCAEAGIAAKVVQKWLGHSTIDMTMNVYTHVNNDFERQAATAFDTFFDT